MKIKTMVSAGSVFLFLLAGCAAVTQRAVISEDAVRNPSLGLFGFTFELPDGFELYNPVAENPEGYNDLQQMSIRIYKTNEAYHPRDNESFYESFLFLSDQACFLLITLKYDYSFHPGMMLPFEEAALQYSLMPLYNVTDMQTVLIGENRIGADWACGHAYEKGGWFYSSVRRKSRLFHYEACKVSGTNRDRYILMGFALPEYTDTLAEQMPDMMQRIKF